MESNLKIVKMTCRTKSYLRIQSFRFKMGRVLELKHYCEEIFEWRAAMIQTF